MTQETDEPYIYDLGVLTPEDSVEVQITIPEDGDDHGYMNFYPYYVDDEKLEEGYNILKAGAMNVESFEDTRVTGTISAKKDAVMFTSIPYDKGWTVKIDGKEIKADSYIPLQDAYLCFNLPKGDHKIEFSFTQRGLLIGAAVSAATVMLLIAAVIFFSILRKKREEDYDKMCAGAETDYQNRLILAERARFTSFNFDDIDLSELDMTELTGRQDIPVTPGVPAADTQQADESTDNADETPGDETPADETPADEDAGDEGEDEISSAPDEDAPADSVTEDEGDSDAPETGDAAEETAGRDDTDVSSGNEEE